MEDVLTLSFTHDFSSSNVVVQLDVMKKHHWLQRVLEDIVMLLNF